MTPGAMEKLLDALRDVASMDEDRDAGRFQRLVAAAHEALGGIDKRLSEPLGVSRTTVLRWCAGTATAHPLMRPAVYRRLALLVERSMRVM